VGGRESAHTTLVEFCEPLHGDPAVDDRLFERVGVNEHRGGEGAQPQYPDWAIYDRLSTDPLPGLASPEGLAKRLPYGASSAAASHLKES
jgi:hypothetical protein